MSKRKKKSKGQQKNRKQQKQSKLPVILVAVTIVCVAVVAVMVAYSVVSKDDTSDGNANMASNNRADNNSNGASSQIIGEGGSLIISTEEITGVAQFYPIQVDGTDMEVLAIRDSNGKIRTAFNTCQSCYDSGRGYYKQEGSDLVCQNCGNHFTPEQVEIQAGGCNPYPIFAENKTVTEDYIEISYDFLKEASSVFVNWKI